MFIIEIILTIIAWIRGWKWKSLIPVGIVLGIGFIVGLIMGVQGYSAHDIENISWLPVMELFGFIAMLIMAIVPPKEVREANKLKRQNKKNETT